jgi:Na+-transporting NADH:ubiquinone oxidoreductase subunit NqrE
MNLNTGNSFWALLVLIADIYAVLNVLQSSADNLKKAVWTALIIVLPLLGVILWYFLGPRSGRA